jgi:hypothetical protein
MTLLTITPPSIGEMTNEQRIQHICAERWIGYPSAKTILQEMEDLLLYPRTFRQPCMLLSAPTGNGKTILLQKFFDRHRPVITSETEQIHAPVIYSQAPSVPSDKMLYADILEALNVPYGLRSTTLQLTMQVKRVLKKLDTKVLIIDEIHHVLAGSRVSQRSFLNAIKGLATELQIVIIGAGIKDAFSAISSDKQLASRFEPAILPLWTMDDEYLRLLSSYETILPLKRESNLTDEDIAMKILSMSGGTIGEITRIIKKAAIQSIRTLNERVDLKMLNQINYVPAVNRQRTYESQML